LLAGGVCDESIPNTAREYAPSTINDAAFTTKGKTDDENGIPSGGDCLRGIGVAGGFGCASDRPVVISSD
jgi:hypothetical protein